MSESTSIDVTVLIATRNRADLLERTLQGLELQRFARDTKWEVVVVDNGSTDRTASVLNPPEWSFELVPLYESNPGKNIALNQGLRVARGRLLVFVDDDIIAEPNWLANLLGATERWPEDGIFGGRIIPELPSTTPNWMRGEDWFLRVAAWGEYKPADVEGPVTPAPNGGNYAVRANVIDNLVFSEQVGPRGKSYAMGSESQFLHRLRNSGYRFIYVPSASVRHIIREDQATVQWLHRRAYNLGRGGVRYLPHL